MGVAIERRGLRPGTAVATVFDQGRKRSSAIKFSALSSLENCVPGSEHGGFGSLYSCAASSGSGEGWGGHAGATDADHND
jgi:hypothetical protein